MNDMIVKNVDVLGDSVVAAKDKNGIVWVGVKWLCRGMGMSEGQWKRQITNIQKDLLLKRGGSNLLLPTESGNQEVFCLQNDYLPIWLAKINITKNIQENNPELAGKLLEYQFRAKDILANAFLPKNEMPKTIDGQIKLLAQGYTDVKEEVDTLKADFEAFKQELPLLPEDADEISDKIKKRGVIILGGKEAPAYNNKSLRQKVYCDYYSNLKYNFGGIHSYKAIKCNQKKKALDIVEKYEPPLFLKEQIEDENAQQRLDL